MVAAIATRGNKPESMHMWICTSIMKIISPSSEFYHKGIDYIFYTEDLDECGVINMSDKNPLDLWFVYIFSVLKIP